MKLTSQNGKPAILVVGSINMDLVLLADRMPATGESYFGNEYHYIPGGKGANQAAAAALLGAEVTFVGRVGSDAHGEKVIHNLESKGIKTDLIARDPELPTGLAVIIVDPSGENRIMVYGGANLNMQNSDLSPAFEKTYDAIMMNFEVPDEIIIQTCRKARELQVPVIIDAGPSREFDLMKLGEIEILSPNETEAEALTGLKCDSEEDARAAAARLAELSNARFIVMKMGDRGALIHHMGKSELINAFKVDAVDATAAGDAFTAAMSVHLLQHADIRKAVRYGNAAGAIAVTRLGAQPSLPNKEETDSFLAEKEYR
jgi:ribokinase